MLFPATIDGKPVTVYQLSDGHADGRTDRVLWTSLRLPVVGFTVAEEAR